MGLSRDRVARYAFPDLFALRSGHDQSSDRP